MNTMLHHFYRDLAFNDFQKIDSPSSLVQYQSQYKYLFMAYHPGKQKELGRVIANQNKQSFDEVLFNYKHILVDLLEKAPSPGMVINALQHMEGYFRDELSEQDKAKFLSLIKQYRKHEITLEPLLGQLNQWAHQHNQDYIKQQKMLCIPKIN